MTVRVDGQNVVRLTWAPGVRIDERLATAAMAMVDELNAGQQRPLLVMMAEIAELTRGARQVFTYRCSASRIALLGASAVDRMLANFFSGVSRAPVPTRFFTSEPAAMAWLLDAGTAP
jgi:hypothetical protein